MLCGVSWGIYASCATGDVRVRTEGPWMAWMWHTGAHHHQTVQSVAHTNKHARGPSQTSL